MLGQTLCLGEQCCTIVDEPEVYEDRDPAQREAEGPKSSMDYSEFFISTKKKQINHARTLAVHKSNYTSVTRTGQTTPRCWDSADSDSASPHTLRSCFDDDCCVNFGSQTICTTPSARCCDKDFLSNTDIGQPTAQNTAYIPGTGLFEVGLQMHISTLPFVWMNMY